MKYSLKFLVLMIIPLLSLEAAVGTTEKTTNSMHKSNLELLNDNTNDDTTYAYKLKPKSALDLEDEKYMQLRQINSNNKRLPSLTLTLAQKHINAKEYILGQYYIKVYLRDYKTYGNMDKAWFLGLKSLFMKFKTSESQQGLLAEIKKVSNDFKQTFSESIYKKKVIDMLQDALTIEYNRNEDIATYYEKRGKLKAAQFYRLKNTNIHLSPSKIESRKSMKPKVHSNLDILDEESFE